MHVEVSDQEPHVIERLVWDGHGCSISQASLSVMVDLVEGKTVDEAMELAGTFHKLMESRGKGLDDESAEESLEDGIVFQGSNAYQVRAARMGRHEGLRGQGIGRESLTSIVLWWKAGCFPCFVRRVLQRAKHVRQTPANAIGYSTEHIRIIYGATMSDTLVPEPQASIFDSVAKALGNDEAAARRVMLNPNLAKGFKDGKPVEIEHEDTKQDACGCGNQAGACGCSEEQDDGIALKAIDDIGRATAADVKEALHQVIDPELGIDVIDLGLVYGIEIDELGRAIITMTLTTPACPLTDLIEDECASTLAGLVEEFRIDWTWQPRWSMEKITPEGREQLAALGFNFDNLPKY